MVKNNISSREGRNGRPTRVLIVVSNLEFGGAQRQIVELVNRIDQTKFDAYICSLSDYTPLADQLNDADKRLYVIEKKFKFDVTVVTRLASLIRKLKIDIAHSFLFDAEIATRLAGRMVFGTAVVGSERNANYSMKRRHLATYWITRRCVDLIIANSNAGAEFSSRMQAQDKSLYRVAHNGVDIERFCPEDGAQIRKELGIAKEDIVIGMFASFKRQKNHPLLFNAAKKILTGHPNARFMMVGDMLYAGMHGSDEYKARIDKMVDELNLRDRFIFLGNRPDVAKLYTACDLTVLPSLFEGTPNVLLESMSCGVPVVATDVSDNSIIVNEGHTGYLIQSEDVDGLAKKLTMLLSDSSSRKKMGANARKWIEENFSTEVFTRKIENIYLDLINDSR